MHGHTPIALLRINGHVGNRWRRIVLPEEQLARVICQRDALVSHLEVHLRRNRQRALRKQNRDRLSDRLRSRQTLRLHGAQEHHVTGGALVEQLPLLRQLRVQLHVELFLNIPVRDQQATGQSQRGDRVLVDQGGQGGENGLIRTALQSHSACGRLDQEVAD